jgi:hypothetical protein
LGGEKGRERVKKTTKHIKLIDKCSKKKIVVSTAALTCSQIAIFLPLLLPISESLLFNNCLNEKTQLVYLNTAWFGKWTA